MKNFFIRYKQLLSVIGIIFLIFIISLLVINFTYKDNTLSQQENEESSYTEQDDCNVLGIELRGEIFTYVPLYSDGNKTESFEDTTTSESVLNRLSEADWNDGIKGVLIEVDSYGGSPAAAEEISNAIKFLQKPVVAYIREAGLSAAYFAIAPADRIFALKNSNVGSIGVTQSYLNNVTKNQKDGYSFIQLSAGKFKDAGSPDKPLTQEERNLFMRDLEIVHENFIETVSENRNIAIENVRAIADGSSVLGEQAKELGLIDEIGDYSDAQIYLDKLIGEESSVCW